MLILLLHKAKGWLLFKDKLFSMNEFEEFSILLSVTLHETKPLCEIFQVLKAYTSDVSEILTL